MKSSNKEQIEKLLLTPQQMNDVYQKLHKQKFVYPYFYKVVKNSHFFYFLGPHHTHKPQDQQINSIKKLWREFLKITKKKNCVVLIEGGLRPVMKRETDAIKEHGEPGLMTFLSNKNKIKIISPEPDEVKEANYVKKNFGREKTMYYYFARQVNQWYRYPKRPNFEKYTIHRLNGYKGLLQWKSFDFSLEHMIKLHDIFHKHKFDLKNEDCFYKDSSPIDSKVAAASSRFRDVFIVNEILKLWRKRKNIFVVYGSGHAITLEPALKEALKDD